MDDRVKVRFISASGEQYDSWAFKGESLWSILASNSVEIDGGCGGQGTCNKCRVRVDGDLSKATQAEKENLNPGEIKRGIRLACHARVEGPVEIYVEEKIFSFAPVKNYLIDFDMNAEIEQDYSYREVFVSGMEKEHSLPFYERLVEALKTPIAIDLDNLVEISRYDRPGRPMIKLNAVLHRNQVIHVGLNRLPLYGLALDLGTTSLFAALVNLESGEMASFASRANSQRSFGDDIVSRVSYAMANSQQRTRLQQILAADINAMISQLLEESQAEASSIFKIMVAANPVMLHFFLGLNPEGFAGSPYTGIFRHQLAVPAYRLGLQANSQAEVTLLPQLGGFIGADAFACLVHLERRFQERFLMIDIGTNGEIVLNDRGRFFATSAAAGPAFEGGAITCGLRGETGAIERVAIDENGGMSLQVIGKASPRGICGSGIVDLAAALLKGNYINEYGTFTEKARQQLNIQDESGGAVLHLEAAPGISFSQQDLRQVQLAKSAIRTGIDILLSSAGLKAEELDKIYLAGAFGNYISPVSATAIGLLPQVPEDKIVGIGNAAAKGAVRALCSSSSLTRVKGRLKGLETVELALRQDFQDTFIKNINFEAAILSGPE